MLPRLSRVFRWRLLREADLDVDKFTKHIPKPVPHGQGGTPFDYSEYIGGKKPAAQPKKDGFFEVCPHPITGQWALSKDTALKNGFHKIKNWYVNPDHWKKGKPGVDGHLQWEGDDWLEPKTPQAKKFVSDVHMSGVQGSKVYKKEIWDRFFAKDFGKFDPI